MSRIRQSLLFVLGGLIAGFFFARPTEANVKITGFRDMDSFGSFDGLHDLEDEDGLCVCRDAPDTTYQITAEGVGTGGPFQLSDGSHTLEYEVWFKQSSGSYVKLSPNVAHSFDGASASQTCDDKAGNINAYFKLVFRANVLAAVPAGTYTGHVSLLLEPI